jgi:hypothetical protein
MRPASTELGPGAAWPHQPRHRSWSRRTYQEAGVSKSGIQALAASPLERTRPSRLRESHFCIVAHAAASAGLLLLAVSESSSPRPGRAAKRKQGRWKWRTASATGSWRLRRQDRRTAPLVGMGTTGGAASRNYRLRRSIGPADILNRKMTYEGARGAWALGEDSLSAPLSGLAGRRSSVSLPAHRRAADRRVRDLQVPRTGRHAHHGEFVAACVR